jgi:hypothetical protein
MRKWKIAYDDEGDREVRLRVEENTKSKADGAAARVG